MEMGKIANRRVVLIFFPFPLPLKPFLPCSTPTSSIVRPSVQASIGLSVPSFPSYPVSYPLF